METIKAQNTANQPFTSHTPKAHNHVKKRSWTIKGIFEAAIVGLAAFTGMPRFQKIDYISSTQELSPYTDFGKGQISSKYPELSYVAAAKKYEGGLELLAEHQETDFPIFYVDTSDAEAPVTVSIEGELKNSPLVRAKMDEFKKYREFEIGREEISSDPLLSSLVEKYESEFSKWHDGKETEVQAVLISKKRRLNAPSYHVDLQRGEDTHFTISYVPSTEVPVTSTHKNWIMADGDVVSIDEDAYTSEQKVIRAYSQSLEAFSEFPVEEFTKPLCVPDITSLILPGMLAKDIDVETSATSHFYAHIRSYHQAVKAASKYLAPSQVVRADIQVHSGPDIKDVRAILDEDYQKNPLSYSVCNPYDPMFGQSIYRIEPRVLLATRYKVIK